MVFVHSRKDTGKTARQLAEIAGREGDGGLFDVRDHDRYPLASKDVKKSRCGGWGGWGGSIIKMGGSKGCLSAVDCSPHPLASARSRSCLMNACPPLPTHLPCPLCLPPHTYLLPHLISPPLQEPRGLGAV